MDVLFGGHAGSGYLGDTWTFDGTNWVQKSPSSSPSAREAAAMAYDAATGTTILFGGYNGGNLGDTWSWNGTTWTQLSPATSPSARRLAAMAYSPALGKIVLFGGLGSSGALADTWTFDGSSWTNMSSSPSPSARDDAGFAYDQAASDLLLFGGNDGSFSRMLGDTWTYGASGWTQKSPAHSPGVRTGMGFADDSVLGHVVLAFGTDGSNDYQDFWLWDGTDWEQGIQPNVGGARHDGLLLPSAGHGQLLSFGGVIGSTELADTGVIDWGQLGTPKNATLLTRPVDDRSSYGVNVYNGNLVVSASDLSVAGVGVGLSLQRRFSNEGGFSGYLGTSWELTNGFDTWWGGLPDGSVVISGVRGAADLLYFHKSGSAFVSPPGINATLASVSGGGYTLTFNASSEKLTFNSAGELTGDADRNGNQISFGWSAGQPASITDTQGRSYTVTVTGGLISEITDPTGRDVDYTYTGNWLTQVSDGAVELTNYSYDSTGDLTGIQDPNGNTTTPGYTAPETRVSSITDPQATPNQVTYAYAAPGAGTGAWGKTTVTDQNSNASSYQAQYGGQVVKATDALGHARKASFNANADQLTAVDANGTGNTATFGYDALNNPISAQIPTGAQVSAQYASGSGCSSSDTIHPYLVKCLDDAQGNQTTFSYDGPGNTLSAKNVTTGATLSYTYNPTSPTCGGKVGQLCTSTDRDANTTGYHYDSAGNLTTISPPAPLGGISQTFDAVGRVATLTDGKAQKTTYSYDGDDRITQVLTGGATSCTYSAGTCVTFGYDANGNRTSMHDVTGLTQYAFDVMNRQTTKTLPSLATLTLGYDHAGNITSYADAGGTVSYGYNAANQLTSLAQPGGSCTGTVLDCTTFGVDNDGQRTSTSYPGNTVMTFTLDAAERPTEAKAVTGSTVISDFSYSYAPAGGGDSEVVQTRTDHTNGRVISYSYDARNELTKAAETSGSTTTAAWLYCYDSAGNRTHASTSTSSTASCTTSPTTSYGYNAGNELTSLNGSSTGWSYDANGNETAANTTTARTGETYSASNQLLSGTMGGSAFTAGYAGLTNDERVTTGSTSFQNGPEGVASQTTSGTTAYYTRDPSGTLNAQRVGADSHYYYLFDGQGSVVAIVNASGGLKNTYSYDPYGNLRSRSVTLSNPFQYIAGYNDATGLYHLGARYYDPTLGRFTQQDPTSVEANAYVYTANNPTNFVDPGGDCFLGIFGSNCGGGGQCSAAQGAEALAGTLGLVGGSESLAAGVEAFAAGGAIAGVTGGLLTLTGFGALALGGFLIVNALQGC